MNYLYDVLVTIGAGSFVLLSLSLLILKFKKSLSSEERYAATAVGFLCLLLLPVLYFGIPKNQKIDVVQVTEVISQSKLLQTDSAPNRNVSTPVYGPVNKITDPAEVKEISSFNIKPIVAYLYLLGVVFLFGMHFLRLVYLKKHVKRLRACNSEKLSALIENCKQNISIKREIRLLMSKVDRSPWTWGLFRPVIVLPEEFDQWSMQEQRDALIHELIHIKRFDQPIIMFAHFCSIVYWFNPLVWLVKNQLIEEVEKSCDDRVLTMGTDAPSYANQLLSIAKDIYKDSNHGRYAAAMADVSSLSQRVKAILNTDATRRPISKLVLCSLMGCAFAILAPLSMVSIGSEEIKVDADGERFIVIHEKDLGHTLLPILNPPAPYPPKALEENIEGFATVEFDVDVNGKVMNEKVIDAFPPEMFNEVALVGIRKFTYIPEKVDGIPAVVTNVKNKFNFRLAIPALPAVPVKPVAPEESLKPLEPVAPVAPVKPDLPDIEALAAKAIASKNSQLHFQVAQQYSDKESWDNALYHVLQASELGGENANPNFNMLAGIVLLKNGMNMEAYRAFSKAVNNSSDAHLRKAANEWKQYAKREQDKKNFIRKSLEKTDLFSFSIEAFNFTGDDIESC